jgi:pilus assembly protein CpaB
MATNVPGSVGSGGLRRAAAASTGKRSGLRAVLFLGFAVVAALGTAVVLTRYLEARTAAVRVPTTKVVVAAVDLPAAAALRAESLMVVDWPTASLPERASSDPSKLVGRVPIGDIAKGEAVLDGKLASSEAGSGLAALLPTGMRAVAVRVDDVVGVAGFVHPGDHVDVIVTMKPVEGGNAPTMSKIILQDIRVLAVGKDVSQAGRADKAVLATVATLMVDSDQSERLALAASKGQLLLALRSRIDRDEIATNGVVPPELLAGDGVSVVTTSTAAPAPAPATARTRPRSASRKPVVQEVRQVERQTVEVIRGDLFEKRDFQKESRQ